MTDERMRIGAIISGGGTNLQAIIDASKDGSLDADVVVVICNHENAYGLERARRSHIPAIYVDRTAHNTFAAYNHAIRQALDDHRVDVVVMAGYMRLLGTEVLDAYPNRVLNIHPALLPSFPGASGIKDAFEYGVKVTGVTVHFANEVFDDGPIIAQESVTVAEDDTMETLEEKIHEIEHRLFPLALQWMASDQLRIDGKRVHVVS